MMPSKNEHNFSAKHHALLFTCISKSVIMLTGAEDGVPIIRKAVRKYGEQRGLRMALRALRNGHRLTMDNYLAYGEWELPRGEMKLRFAEKVPHARVHILKCPWNDVWAKNNLLEYGMHFCKEIDAALVRGFNPDLEIDIKSIQTHGADYCDFIYKEANLSAFKMLCLAYKKKIKPGKNAIMPWEYHAGHLLKTMGEVIRNELKNDSVEIMESAIEKFRDYASEQHITKLKKYQSTNFEIIPD